MIARLNWEAEYENEVQHAIAARQRGNEGMMRVCCRRAAGIVIGEFLLQRGIKNISNSFYDRLVLFDSLPDIDESIKRVSRNFLIKVNQDHRLPVNANLLEDVAWLKEVLLVPQG